MSKPNNKLVPLAAFFLFATAFINLSQLENYSAQTIPAYINKDNTPNLNPISDAGATLGRVLFYDKKLSANSTVACGSCHHQSFAFSDTARLSTGLFGGVTGRHAMRLAYARFGDEAKFFWDERAASLENQTTRPVQDAVEMGFSGANGQPGFDSLVRKLSSVEYYKTLFKLVYGDTVITEERVQNALAQFVRSIHSFDSKFDIGLAQAPNLNAPFQNFTAQENQGKTLFINPPNAGGAGCQGCHRAPEFDIDPNAQNNGVLADANNPNVLDLTNTRAPSLRDLFNPQGVLNGPLMHNGDFRTIEGVVDHYNLVPQNPNNTNLDNRLRGPGGNLQLSQNQKDALIAFLKTLSSQEIYTHEKWSDPFDENGNLELITGLKNLANSKLEFYCYPNPTGNYLNVQTGKGDMRLSIYNQAGELLRRQTISGHAQLDLSSLQSGTLIVEVEDLSTGARVGKRIVKY